MPVYNVERYLSEAAGSVLNQTFRDFELILVDDASPDGSGKICDTLKDTDERVKVIHKRENGGVSAARNTGMDAAAGEYIFFMDSDDTVGPTMFSDAMAAVDDCDIFVFGFIMRHEDKGRAVTFEEERRSPNAVCTTQQNIAMLSLTLDENGVFGYLWNKLYRAAFLKSCRVAFDTGQNNMEDFFFNIGVFPQANKVISVERAYYIYRKPQEQTLVSRYTPEFFNLSKRRYMVHLEYLQSVCIATEENLQILYAVFFKHLISSLIRDRSAACLNKTQKREHIAQYLSDPLTVEILGKYTPSGMKMNILLRILRGKCLPVSEFAVKVIAFVQRRAGKIFSHLR